MGTALQHLDGLVQMPSGCGEQNMVIFAPIIYVLQYLEKTGLLTEDIRSRAVGFLDVGKLDLASLDTLLEGLQKVDKLAMEKFSLQSARILANLDDVS